MLFNPFNLHIIILLLAFFYHSSAQDHSHDICSTHGGYPTPVTIPYGSSLSVTNSVDCVKTFQIDFSDPNYANKYLLIEVTISPFPNDANSFNYQPYLIGKKGSSPGIDNPRNYNNNANVPGYVDQSGYTNRKNYHYLSVDKNDNSGSGMFYIAFYRTILNTLNSDYYTGSVSYNIKATATSTYQCPQDCSGQNHGICDTVNKKCNCTPPYFDSDCSIAANLLSVPTSKGFAISPNGWTYLYLPVVDFGDDLLINFTAIDSQVEIYTEKIYQDNFTLPSVNKTARHRSLNQTTSTFVYIYLEDYQDADEGMVIVFGMQNAAQNTSIQVNFACSLVPETPDLTTDNDNVGIMVIAGILGFIAFLAIIALIWLGRRRKRRLRELAIHHFAGQTRDATPPEEFLTVEQLDRYFPKKPYNEQDNLFQPSCSICLDDLQGVVISRQLYCGHVFHDNCIEEWLKKHTTCPNCNKLMTAQAIKGFNFDRRTLNELKKKQSMDMNHISILSEEMPLSHRDSPSISPSPINNPNPNHNPESLV